MTFCLCLTFACTISTPFFSNRPSFFLFFWGGNKMACVCVCVRERERQRVGEGGGRSGAINPSHWTLFRVKIKDPTYVCICRGCSRPPRNGRESSIAHTAQNHSGVKDSIVSSSFSRDVLRSRSPSLSRK